MRLLVNSFIREVNRIWLRRRKSFAARQWKRKHAIGKIRAVSMETAIEDNKRCSIVVRK